MLKDLLYFPEKIEQTNMSINEICDIISDGYTKQFPKLEELIGGLRSNRKLIGLWMQFSENKRGSPSWYFLKAGEKYIVGYLDTDYQCNEGMFEDQYFACAVFIKLEMESRLIATAG